MFVHRRSHDTTSWSGLSTHHRGRDTRCRGPPAQIPACSLPAPGSSLCSLATSARGGSTHYKASFYRSAPGGECFTDLSLTKTSKSGISSKDGCRLRNPPTHRPWPNRGQSANDRRACGNRSLRASPWIWLSVALPRFGGAWPWAISLSDVSVDALRKPRPARVPKSHPRLGWIGSQ
jgi:hypothetical protein